MSKTQIIFDFDGVILNSHKVKTVGFYFTFKKFGNSIGSKAKNYHLKNIGISRFAKFRYIKKKILGDNKIKITDLNKKFNDYCFNKIISLKVNHHLLNFLKKNYKKYDFFISTGTPEKEIIKILKNKGIFHFFKKIYGSPRKKVEHINLIKKRKQKRIFIGDSEEDLFSAKKTSTFFILKEHSENKEQFKKLNIYKINNFLNFELKIEKLVKSL